MRSMLAPVLAIALTATSAFAADDAPLPAGKPAGVQQAQMGGHGLMILLGLGFVAGGIALVMSQGKNNNPTVSTATTAP